MNRPIRHIYLPQDAAEASGDAEHAEPLEHLPWCNEWELPPRWEGGGPVTLQGCRALCAEPATRARQGEHRFTHILSVPGSVKTNKSLITTSPVTLQQTPHSSCKSEVFTGFSESPTQFPYALIYTPLKASFWPQLNNLSQKDCKLSEKVLVIIIFLHLYSITSVLKAFSYSASGDKKLKCLCSQVH